jgi:hypothetical protein
VELDAKTAIWDDLAVTEHFSMPKVDFVQSDAGYAVEVVSRTKV